MKSQLGMKSSGRKKGNVILMLFMHLDSLQGRMTKDKS